MEEFKRKVEDIPIGFVVTGANTRSSMVGTNKVSYEMIPPAGGENRYKAVVTIVSQTQYSFHRSKSTGEEGDKEQNGQNQSTLNERKDSTSISILDSTLAGKATRSSSEANGRSSDKNDSAEEVAASRPDQRVRKYDLVYENGRWVLATKPDPKNEKSIQFAFDQALSGQG
jgi:basic membrane lipoprotein Med (substrate-binding protein (PBP1-ABC) superfamily)